MSSKAWLISRADVGKTDRGVRFNMALSATDIEAALHFLVCKKSRIAHPFEQVIVVSKLWVRSRVECDITRCTCAGPRRRNTAKQMAAFLPSLTSLLQWEEAKGLSNYAAALT